MNFSFIISTCVIVCVTVVIRNVINQILILEMVLFCTPFGFHITTVEPSWLHNSSDPVSVIKYQVTKPVNYLFVGWAYNSASFRLFGGPLVLEVYVTYLGPVYENKQCLKYLWHQQVPVSFLLRHHAPHHDGFETELKLIYLAIMPSVKQPVSGWHYILDCNTMTQCWVAVY